MIAPQGLGRIKRDRASYQLDDFDQAATALPEKEVKVRENPLQARMVENKDSIGRATDSIDWLVPDLITPDELSTLFWALHLKRENHYYAARKPNLDLPEF